MTGERYFTISQVSGMIERAISGAFPDEFWVVGEIQGLDRGKHRNHWYFELAETNKSGDVFKLSATIWKGVRKRLFGPHGTCAGVFDIAGELDGMKIMALCRVNFYPPYGKISLIVNDINPEFTLGELEARRKELLERLKKEGLLEKNAGLDMPEVPLTIGLITSDGSAAYNDFLEELTTSGFGFRILFCDARMQGEDSLITIPAAFKTLEALGPDLIVLIRGGGSRLDLSWFDREEIVFSVSGCRLPVVTGIGHEIDLTLSELVAHTGTKTPTAAGAFVIERVRKSLDRLVDRGRNIAEKIRERVQKQEDGLRRNIERVRTASRLAQMSSFQELREQGQLLSAAVLSRIGGESEILGLFRSRLAAGRHLRNIIDLLLEQERFLGKIRDLPGRKVEKALQSIALLSEKNRLLDPVRVIRRGFAVIKDKKGGIVKGIAGLSVGDVLSVILRDGRLSTEIRNVIEEDEHGCKKAQQLEIW